nr:MAG TPA: hypothetical protein [Caudoviricetes sp.]
MLVIFLTSVHLIIEMIILYTTYHRKSTLF